MDTHATPYTNLKIFAHPEKLDAIRQGKHTAPVYFRIKPTNTCNHHCYYCSYADKELALRDGVRITDQIPWERMQGIIEDLGEMGVKAVTFSGGGEPLMYPHILPAMERILKKRIDLSLITNGQRLNGEIADILTKAKWVRISMDSADAETYSRIRRIPPSSFTQVCENIRRFTAAKPADCELGINFVVNHENAAQIYNAAVLVRDFGVNHIKFTARVTKDLDAYHEPFKKSAIEQIHRAAALAGPGFSIINKYEDDFHLCTVFNRTYSRCAVKEVVSVIAADSKVYFCHDKAYVSSGVIGDLNGRSLKELWFAPETVERFRHFDARKECKHHCVYDDRNVLINTFLSLNCQHINFI